VKELESAQCRLIIGSQTVTIRWFQQSFATAWILLKGYEVENLASNKPAIKSQATLRKTPARNVRLREPTIGSSVCVCVSFKEGAFD